MLLDKSYWNCKGLHQSQVEQLNNLIPDEGMCKNHRSTNRCLEKFRRASNCYYDLFNNGLCNRASEFYKVFGFSGTRIRTTKNYTGREAQWLESTMDDIIVAACKEQGIAVDENAGHYYLALT